jgi:hypothetical protein
MPPIWEAWPFCIRPKTKMAGSFIEMLNQKSAEQPKSQEAPEAYSDDVAVAEMEQEYESEIEEPQELEISEIVRKELSEKGSFLDRIKEANELQAQQEAEALASEEEELAEAEQEEEEQEVKPPVFEVEIDGKKYENLEEVQNYLYEVQEEKKALEAEKTEIQNFVDKMSDPTMLEVMKYVGQGFDFPVALIKAGIDESIFDLDTLEEPTAEQVIRAKIEREQAQKEHQKQQAKLQKNMEESNRALVEFQTKEGFDEKTKTDLVSLMSKIHSEILDGLVTNETLSIFAKALNYEKVVEESKAKIKQAEEAGEIKGMNKKIAIERQKKQGDGLPNLNGPISKELPKKENRLLSMVNIPEGSFMEKLKRGI